jgi:hypothetical protein
MTGSQNSVNHPIIRLAGFALILLNFCVGIIFIYVWLSASQKDYFEHVDFTTFYTAGAIARDGLGARLYDLSLQAGYQAKILNQSLDQTAILPFNNPPFTVYPFILFSKLPLNQAFILWTVIQLAMLMWLLYNLFRFSMHWSRMERWLMISGSIAFTPLLIDFMLGTFSLLLLLSLFQFYISLKNERQIHGAGWLLVQFIKPQVALLPAVMLLGVRRWKAIGAAALMGICLFGITAISFGPRIWLDFARNINTASANFNSFGIVPAIEYNLKGFLTMLLGESQAGIINLISIGALLISIVLVLWIWLGSRLVKDSLFEVKFSLVVVLSLVLSLHLNPYDSLLLILPAVLFYNYLRGRKSSGLAFGIFSLCFPYIFLFDFFVLSGQMGFHFPFVMMVIIGLWIAKELFLRGQQKDMIASEITGSIE